MDVSKLSENYQVRQLDKNDVSAVLALCGKNSLYYRHCPPAPSEEQKKMAADASRRPVVYGPDCPKSSPERLRRFRECGERKRHGEAGKPA